MTTGSADSFIGVNLDGFGLRAELTIPSGTPPEYLTPEILGALLRARNVEVGPEVQSQIERLLADYRLAPKASITRVVASATPAVHGQDTRVEFFPRFQRLVSKQTAWEDGGEDGPVDHYARSSLCLVERGDRIARYFPPTPGVEGRAVTGGVLPARDGRPLPFRIDPSISIEDGHLTAMTGGAVELSGAVLRVSERLDIDGDADFSTGNINFFGSVTIRGSVKDRFSITCRDCLEVLGLVGAARIKAGVDADFRCGMAGRECGSLEVGRDLKAGYLENVTGVVGRDMIVSNALHNCDLVCGNSVRSPRATLAGGRLVVASLAVLGAVGSDGATSTCLELGRLPRIEEKLRPAAQAQDMLLKKIERLLARRTQLDTGGRQAQAQVDELKALALEIASYEQKLMALRLGSARLLKALEAIGPPTLRVMRTIHPGAIIGIGSVLCRVHTALHGESVLTLNQGGEPDLSRSGVRIQLGSVARVESDGTRTELDRLIRSLGESIPLTGGERTVA